MKRNRLIKPRKPIINVLSLFIVISMLLNVFVIIGNAVSYYTIRINYVFKIHPPCSCSHEVP